MLDHSMEARHTVTMRAIVRFVVKISIALFDLALGLAIFVVLTSLLPGTIAIFRGGENSFSGYEPNTFGLIVAVSLTVFIMYFVFKFTTSKKIR
jgi:hypothetical protein